MWLGARAIGGGPVTEVQRCNARCSQLELPTPLTLATLNIIRTVAPTSGRARYRDYRSCNDKRGKDAQELFATYGGTRAYLNPKVHKNSDFPASESRARLHFEARINSTEEEK